MRCARCGSENPEQMKFCIHCGARLEVYEPSHAIPRQLLRPAYRPFGVVLITVYSIVSGLAWIAMSLYPIVGAMGVAPFRVETSYIIGLAMLSILLEVLGILEVTGALGLWLLTRWGRNLTIGIQGLSIILGILIVVASSSEEVQRANLSVLLVLIGLFTIVTAIAIIIYLLQARMEEWFQE